jgi:hypothetical protein
MMTNVFSQQTQLHRLFCSIDKHVNVRISDTNQKFKPIKRAIYGYIIGDITAAARRLIRSRRGSVSRKKMTVPKHRSPYKTRHWFVCKYTLINFFVCVLLTEHLYIIL